MTGKFSVQTPATHNVRKHVHYIACRTAVHNLIAEGRLLLAVAHLSNYLKTIRSIPFITGIISSSNDLPLYPEFIELLEVVLEIDLENS